MFTTEQLHTISQLRGRGYQVVSQTLQDDACYRLIVRRAVGAPCVRLTLKPDGSYTGLSCPCAARAG